MDGWRQTLRKCGVLRRMDVSRSTSPVWCAACVRSPPRALALFENGGSGLPPSGTRQGASDASQSVSGFLEEQKGKMKEIQWKNHSISKDKYLKILTPRDIYLRSNILC